MLIAEILNCSVAEKIQMVEDIWDSISNSPDALEVSSREKPELDRRLADFRENPEKGIDREAMRNRVSRKSDRLMP